MTIQNRGGRYFNQSGRVASVGIHHLDNPNWLEGTPKQLTDQNEGVDKNE